MSLGPCSSDHFRTMQVQLSHLLASGYYTAFKVGFSGGIMVIWPLKSEAN
jgi:hypothetical protein